MELAGPSCRFKYLFKNGPSELEFGGQRSDLQGENPDVGVAIGEIRFRKQRKDRNPQEIHEPSIHLCLVIVLVFTSRQFRIAGKNIAISSSALGYIYLVVLKLC